MYTSVKGPQGPKVGMLIDLDSPLKVYDNHAPGPGTLYDNTEQGQFIAIMVIKTQYTCIKKPQSTVCANHYMYFIILNQHGSILHYHHQGFP